MRERLKQKYRTLDWPRQEPLLSSNYRGMPQLVDVDCGNCNACFDVCPTDALERLAGRSRRTPFLDMGKCIFCGACEQVCPQGAFAFGSDWLLATRSRQALLKIPQKLQGPDYAGATEESEYKIEEQLLRPQHGIFRKSLKLRQISAGGCNACEADCNVLGTLTYDLGRFGIEFTASPRHADALLLTGPISLNMLAALQATWLGMPGPRLLCAVGACAISGGLFHSGSQCAAGVDNLADITGIEDFGQQFQADVFIPGCPPNPWSILAGILELRQVERKNL